MFKDHSWWLNSKYHLSVIVKNRSYLLDNTITKCFTIHEINISKVNHNNVLDKYNKDYKVSGELL